MPIFEFECESCSQPFEELVFGSAIDTVTCPECGSPEIRKKMSTFASRISGGSVSSVSSNPAASCNTGSV